MNALLSKLEQKCLILTLRRAIPATSKARLCSGSPPAEPVVPSKKPFRVQLEGGKRYSWCTCGYSRKQPFCDGAHKLRAPSLKPLRFVPEEDAAAWLCGCKRTGTPPHCDGTHKQDAVVSAPLHRDGDA